MSGGHRLVSVLEAIEADIAPGVFVGQIRRDGSGWVSFARPIPALARLPNRDAFQLWRSLPGYRRACRMLRRSGRDIRQRRANERMRWRVRPCQIRPEDLAGVSATLLGINPDDCQIWRSDTRHATAASIIQDIEAMKILATKER